jgi:hypothetical protein
LPIPAKGGSSIVHIRRVQGVSLPAGRQGFKWLCEPHLNVALERRLGVFSNLYQEDCLYVLWATRDVTRDDFYHTIGTEVAIHLEVPL